MTFDGAVVREQGVTFGIAVVRAGTLRDSNGRDSAVAGFKPRFRRHSNGADGAGWPRPADLLRSLRPGAFHVVD